MKIAVYAIAKNESKNAMQFIESTKEADGIYVLDTGCTDDTTDILRKHNVNVTVGGPTWDNWTVKKSRDFAKSKGIPPWRFDVARNMAMALVPKDFDFCVWQDFDEKLKPGWREAVANRAELGATRVQAWLVHSFRADGTPDLVYYQDRAHARGGYKWIGMAHELVIAKNPEKEKMVQSQKFEVHHYQDASKPRTHYLPLLECQCIENPKSDRYAYYLGREYWYCKEYDKAITELSRYLDLAPKGHSGYRSEACHIISGCYEAISNLFEAERWALHACVEGPEFRESWVWLGWYYFNRKNHAGGYYANQRALEIKDRPTWYSTTAEAWGVGPLEKSAYNLWYLGNPKGALKLYEEVLAIAPDDKVIRADYEKAKRDLNAALKMYNRKIWQNMYWHLGDCWFFCNAIMHMPPQNGPIYVSAKAQEFNTDIRKNIEDILPLLENKHNHKIEIVEPDTGALEAFHKNWQVMQPVPTKLNWLGLKTDRICYQFDGVWKGDLKNPSKADLEFIFAGLKDYKLIKLGLPMTLAKIVTELAASTLFIGADSGMAHVAASVGIPSIVYLPEAVKEWKTLYEQVKTIALVYSAYDLVELAKQKMA